MLKIVGIPAPSTAETGAAKPIFPEASALKNNGSDIPPIAPAASDHNT